jgi:hypothetical protein
MTKKKGVTVVWIKCINLKELKGRDIFIKQITLP